MIAFGQALPKIRRRVSRDVRRRGLPREKILAAGLLELTALRVGNEEYVNQNRSYRLTTIKNHHVRVRGRSITFDFRGKSGKHQHVDVEHPVLSRIVRKCQDLPGRHLFQYVGRDGRIRCVTSEDVNDYLASITRGRFTAKDFRTWTGTILAALALRDFESAGSERGAKANIVRAIKQVAERLGNTPAVCKKCYIHPVLLESYLNGALLAALEKMAASESGDPPSGLRSEEAAVITLLQRQRERTGSNE